MDKPKTPWPLHVQEIMQRIVPLLEGCPFACGFMVDTNRVADIMRSGAADSFWTMVRHCESQPGFLPEQLDEVADDVVTATLALAPFRLKRIQSYQESVPAIRKALKRDLQAMLEQREGWREPEACAPMAAEGVGPDINGRKAERKKLRDDYKAECKRARVTVTDKMIAEAANPSTPNNKGWHSRSNIQKWLACNPKYEGKAESNNKLDKCLKGVYSKVDDQVHARAVCLAR